MADELFRFVHLRGAVPAEADDNLLVRAWSDPPSDLETQLVAAAEAGENPTLIAQQWLSEAGQEGPITALRQLDAAITGPVDNVTVGRFRDMVRRYLDTNEVLDRARRMAQDALLAVALTPDLPFKNRDTAHRLVILAVAGQKALQRGNGDREGQRRDQVLRDILTRGAAVLPGRVSQLFGPAPVQQQERRLRRRPQAATDLQAAQRRRDAALAELVAIAVDPDVTPEVIQAVAEPLPDEADPRLRPTGEMAVRPARMLLRDAVRERLSEATRTLLDQVAPGRTDLLSAISTVERASLWTVPAARAAAVDNDPTGGFPSGYGALRPPVQGLVRPPGIGELLSVRREHANYVLGPITHIENVLAGETRERTHRRLDRTEEQTFFETERTVVDERDLQATERFDMVTETRNEVNAQTQLQVGAQVSGSYGTVQASASFGFTSSSASTDVTRTATTNARETVDRALKRITERTLERRQRITIREVEETNRHELTNSSSDTNRAGIYRFVDDEQTVGVYSYGRRLMFETHVPEPGAYLRWATAQPAGSTADPEPPRPSLPDGTQLTSPDQLNPANYRMVAGPYGAVVEPPPPLLTTVAICGRQDFNQNTPSATTPAFLFYRSEDRLQVPDGYRARRATGVMHASAWKFDVYIAVGAANFRDTSHDAAMPLVFSVQLADETTTVPLAFTINNAWGFAYTLEVICERTDRALERWQIQTFNAIMQAYDDRHSAWQERQRAASISTAGVVTGTNPALNRQVERAELKKAVISLLSGSPLDQFGAITQATLDDEPIIDNLAAVGQSAVIAFYEQAFEWEQTIYTLYPYFWGRHATWTNAFTGDSVDPLHEAFLEAGLARVVVPVRPGFEQVALWFLATGQVWYGGSPPPISSTDPLYVSIAAELLAADEANRGGVLQGNTWQVTTPTNLIYLQQDASLNPSS